MPTIIFSDTEPQFVRLGVDNLLKKGILVESQHILGEFVSNIFLRKKKGVDKFHTILNSKHLNNYVKKKHFKMDTLLPILPLITPNCTFVSFDFSYAYYSCSIFPPCRRYLRFTFEGRLYEFTCLPNGLSSTTRFFTKIMKVALSHFIEYMDITISGYLNEFHSPEATNFALLLKFVVHLWCFVTFFKLVTIKPLYHKCLYSANRRLNA